MLGSQKIMAFVGVTSRERAKAFYAEKLGLKVASEDPYAVTFDANGILLRAAIISELKPVHFTVLGWQVPDIQAVAHELEQAGVAFERYPFFNGQDDNGIWTFPGGDRVAWFKDLDGNTLSIAQMS